MRVFPIPTWAAGWMALLLAFLLPALGCTQSSSGAPLAQPSALSYQDPPAVGYRFQGNAQLSRPDHLVLDLRGPAGATARGVTFTLSGGTGALAWMPVAPLDPHFAANVLFDLPEGPNLFWTTAQDGRLSVMLFQKGKGNAKPMDSVICRVALDLQQARAALGIQPLSVDRFQILPDTGPDLVDADCTLGSVIAQ